MARNIVIPSTLVETVDNGLAGWAGRRSDEKEAMSDEDPGRDLQVRRVRRRSGRAHVVLTILSMLGIVAAVATI
jgi:hypothetical protein